jgi:hypothetical protein
VLIGQVMKLSPSDYRLSFFASSSHPWAAGQSSCTCPEGSPTLYEKTHIKSVR